MFNTIANFFTNYNFEIQNMLIHTGIVTWGFGLFYLVGTRYEKAQKRHWAKRRHERAREARRQNKMV